MRKSFTRTVALIAALFTVCLLLTGCLGYGSGAVQPKIDDKESGISIAEEERKLIFTQAAETVQVNVETAVGYFCYEDNTSRILTDREYDIQIPVADEDGNAVKDENGNYITTPGKCTQITELSVTLYDGENKPVDPSKYTCKINENGYVVVKSEEMGKLEIKAKNYLGKELEKPVQINIVRQSFSIFDIIMLGVGLYLLFAAITGKGRLYEAEFVKEGMEKKHKLIIRLTCLVISLLMIANGVVAALDAYGKYKYVSFILLAAMLVVFVAALLLIRSCTDREAKKEAQEKRMSGHDLKAPAAAFDFDEDEPTVDDIKAEPQNSGENK